jgi:hypothetical protein
MASDVEKEETRNTILEAFGQPAGRAIIRQDLRTSRTLERLRAIVTGQVAAAPMSAAATEASEPASETETPAAAEVEAAPETDDAVAPVELEAPAELPVTDVAPEAMPPGEDAAAE